MSKLDNKIFDSNKTKEEIKKTKFKNNSLNNKARLTLDVKKKIIKIISQLIYSIIHEKNRLTIKKKINIIKKYNVVRLVLISYLKQIIKINVNRLKEAEDIAENLNELINFEINKEKNIVFDEIILNNIIASIIEDKIENKIKNIKKEENINTKDKEKNRNNIISFIKNLILILKEIGNKFITKKKENIYVVNNLEDLPEDIVNKLRDQKINKDKIKKINNPKYRILTDSLDKTKEIQNKTDVNKQDDILIIKPSNKPVINLTSQTKDNLDNNKQEQKLKIDVLPIHRIKPDTNNEYLQFKLKKKELKEDKRKTILLHNFEKSNEESTNIETSKRLLNYENNNSKNIISNDSEDINKILLKRKIEPSVKQKDKKKVKLSQRITKLKQKLTFSNKTEIPSYLKDIRLEIKDQNDVAIQKYKRQILRKETENIKNILNTKKIKRSIFVDLSDYLVKSLTVKLMNTFPSFFKSLFNNVRLSGLRILGNSYANMLVLASIITFVVSLISFSFFLTIFYNNYIIAIIKALMLALIFTVANISFFYVIPKTIITQRKKDIETNLPFAITHMAALSNSGVNPLLMFELIGKTENYGEISRIFKRIIELINKYGYDLVTAIKTILERVPSDKLKEFLHGFLATIETGGSLDLFLERQRTEALLQYKLEREKYVKTVSTYSDIYTGILVAAPLFFIITLSLVNMLGGKIGNLDVKSLIAIGTYFLIPVLNISFIIFLRLTQPKM